MTSLLFVSLVFSAASVSAADGDEVALSERPGAFDAISAVVDDVVAQVEAGEKLGRFRAYRGIGGITREKSSIVDFIVANSGGPPYQTGRKMDLSQERIRIDEQDWDIRIEGLKETP